MTTRDTPSFYTIDRGTSSTAAALIAPVDGRYRLLGSATAATGVDPEALLEDLAWRVARADASVAESLDGWQDWSRLEVHTGRAPRACLVAASAATGALLERALSGAGWHISARFFDFRPDLVALGEACLDPNVDAIVVGGREDVEEVEREHMRLLWPLAGSLARMRDDLAIIACGPFVDRPEGIPDERLFSLPAPEAVAATSESALRQAALQVGAHLGAEDRPARADGRTALRASISSLAALLGDRVEGIEVGAAAGSRTLAHPEGELRHSVIAAGAFLPSAMLDDEASALAILRWSTLRGDPATHMDHLRELCLRPWSGIDQDSTRLRMAALRASLERMQAAWDAANTEGRPDDDVSDVVVLSGGAFSAVPAVAAALALVDSVRRPGAVTILHDHARILAPLGALPVEGDRRRLLADLMDDSLVPIGSAVVTGALHGGGKGSNGGGTMSISTALGDDELRLEPDRLRLVDLPPGIVARLEIDPEQGSILGVEGQRLTLEVSGGLGGLLVDTREIKLPLPDGGEARRAKLESWEAPVWANGRA
ncbi:MAG: hypothetical protein ACC726_11595 [Chloroflexota bacterium]